MAEPQPGPLWQGDPRIRNDEVRALFDRLDAEILPFESRHFGQDYPYGNKIEMLAALPESLQPRKAWTSHRSNVVCAA